MFEMSNKSTAERRRNDSENASRKIVSDTKKTTYVLSNGANRAGHTAGSRTDYGEMTY